MNKPPVPLESEIQKQCLQYLTLVRIRHWRANTAKFSVGEGQRKRWIACGEPGQSDIMGVLAPSGRFLAIEVKRPGERATDHQEAWLQTIRDAGGVAGVVHSVEELKVLLEGAS